MLDLCSNEIKYRNIDKTMAQHPYRMTVSGCSGTGKTYWLIKNLCQHKDSSFDRIIWCAPEYSLQQQKLKNFQKNMNNSVMFIDGLDTDKIDELLNNYCSKGCQTCLVLDDLMYEQNSYINNLFTSGRHKNCSIIELTQRLFNSSKSRTNRLNTNYFVLFSFGDLLECSQLFRQINPLKYKEIIRAYQKITDKKHHCMIIDKNYHKLDVKNKKLLKFRDTVWDESIVNLSEY